MLETVLKLANLYGSLTISKTKALCLLKQDHLFNEQRYHLTIFGGLNPILHKNLSLAYIINNITRRNASYRCGEKGTKRLAQLVKGRNIHLPIMI